MISPSSQSTAFVPKAIDAEPHSLQMQNFTAHYSVLIARFTRILTLSYVLWTYPNLATAEPDLSVEPISPIPTDMIFDSGKVALGKRLFSDTRLSYENGVSCASCHIAEHKLTDGKSISRGLPGSPGETNVPTLYNVGLNPMHGWAGQSKTLEEQVDMVVRKKSTMGAYWDGVIAILNDDESLSSAFSAVYADGITQATITDALAEYERSLVTPNAPFDKFLRGDDNAINEQAKAGYILFKNYGCSSCHQGVNVGGNMFQVFGIFSRPDDLPDPHTPGAAKNTGIDDSRPVFRVPPLRNVAETGPYFHNGSAETLPEAIKIMGSRQLGRDLSDDDVTKLYEFLKSLSGEYNGVSVSGR